MNNEFILSLQQAYHAIAVSRKMKLLALNSSANRSSREGSSEKSKTEEPVRTLWYFVTKIVLTYCEKNLF